MSDKATQESTTVSFEVERMTVRDPKTGHRFDVQMNPAPTVPVTVIGHTDPEVERAVKAVMVGSMYTEEYAAEVAALVTQELAAARLQGKGERSGNG